MDALVLRHDYFKIDGVKEMRIYIVNGKYVANVDVDVDVEWMYELRQSPLCPPQTYTIFILTSSSSS